MACDDDQKDAEWDLLAGQLALPLQGAQFQSQVRR